MSYDEECGDESGGASPTYDYADDALFQREEQGQHTVATAAAQEATAVAAGAAVSAALPPAAGTVSSPARRSLEPPSAAHTPRNHANTSSQSTAAAHTAAATSSAAVPHHNPGSGNKASAWPIKFSQALSQSGNKKSNKRKSGSSSQQTLFGLSQSGGGSQLAEGGSRFVECPACQRSIPYFDLDDHLDHECGRDDNSSSGKKRKAGDGAVGGVDPKPRPVVLSKRVEQLVASQNSGSSFGSCPACGENVVLATINHHLDIECRMRANQRPRASHAVASTQADAASSNGVSATAAAPVVAVPVAAAPVTISPAAAAAPSVPLAPSVSSVVAAPPASLPAAAHISSPNISADPAVLGNETLLISQTEPAVLLESPAPASAPSQPPEAKANDPAAVVDSTPGVDSSSSAAAATAASPHPFFTSGPLAASAFLPQRRSRYDSVKCDALVHFTAVRCDAYSAAVPSPNDRDPAPAPAHDPADGGVVCEWQDCPNPSNAGYLPTLCASAPFHSNTKCHEGGAGTGAGAGAGDVWTDVHIHAARSFLQDSPPVDLAAPTLPNNQRTGRRFNLSQSQLKSLLQKNVRLSRPAAAVRCALQLMNFSLIEFLRRFSVIIFEDAILHPHLPFLVWMTLALGKKTGFVPTQLHVDRLLQMVHEVAGVGVKDALLPGEGGSEDEPSRADEADEGNQTEMDGDTDSPSAAAAVGAAGATVGAGTSPSTLPPPTLADPLPDLTPPQRMLVKSILARACMGGSAWDVRLLRNYARLWSRRFRAENQHQRARVGGEFEGAGTVGAGAAQRGAPQSPASLALMSPASGSWLSFLGALYSPGMCPVPPKLRVTGPVSVLALGYFADDDLVLSAIDFHCSDILDRVLDGNGRARTLIESKCSQTHGSGKCPSCADVLKSLMWRYRSSLTNKHALRPGADAQDAPDPAAERMFQQIKTEIDQAAKRIIAGRIQYG